MGEMTTEQGDAADWTQCGGYFLCRQASPSYIYAENQMLGGMCYYREMLCSVGCSPSSGGGGREWLMLWGNTVSKVDGRRRSEPAVVVGGGEAVIVDLKYWRTVWGRA